MPEPFVTDADPGTGRSGEEGKETPLESSANNKPNEDGTASPAGDKGEGTPGSEKGEPKVFHAFHEHPKWKEMTERLKDLSDFRESVLPLLEQLNKKQEKPEEKSSAIPDWFIDLYGENDAAWRKYQQHTASERKAIREEIMGELQEQSKKQTEETKKWNDWVSNEIQDVLSDADIVSEAKALGVNFDDEKQSESFRNEILQTAIRQVEATKKDANIWRAVRAVLAQKAKTAKPVSDEHKKIADKTMSKGKPEEGAKAYKTSHDLAGFGFRDLI